MQALLRLREAAKGHQRGGALQLAKGAAAPAVSGSSTLSAQRTGAAAERAVSGEVASAQLQAHLAALAPHLRDAGRLAEEGGCPGAARWSWGQPPPLPPVQGSQQHCC